MVILDMVICRMKFWTFRDYSCWSESAHCRENGEIVPETTTFCIWRSLKISIKKSTRPIELKICVMHFFGPIFNLKLLWSKSLTLAELRKVWNTVRFNVFDILRTENIWNVFVCNVVIRRMTFWTFWAYTR